MRVLHLQLMGGPGGIVSLCRSINIVSKNKEYFYFLFSGGEVADKIREEGGCVVIRNEAHFNILPGLKRFLSFCKKEKIDLLIAHTNSAIIWIYAIVAKNMIRKLRLKTYIHSDPYAIFGNGLKRWVRLKLFQYACHCSENVIAISEFVKCRTAEMLKLDEDKLIVLYNGIIASQFQCIHDDSDAQRMFQIIYVGRIYPFKNVILLPDVMKLLPEMIHLTIVGSGPDMELVKRNAVREGVASRITFLGDRMDIPDLLEKSDLFVHPAKWEEGFGITLIEAMAAGVPCVAFRKGAIPEIIDHNENGWIVEDVTAEAFAEQIKKSYQLFLNGRYAMYRESARKKGAAFSIEKLIQGLENIAK